MPMIPYWRQLLAGAALLILLLCAALLLRQPRRVAPQRAQEQLVTLAKVAQAPLPDSPLPTAIVEGTIEPTTTPLPTFTPWPTATRRPGPTATPISLPEPADSPAGVLLYTLRTKADGYVTSGKILQIQLDAKGEVISPIQEIGPGWMRSYVSWDRTLAAFVDRTMSGEHIYIVNPTTGKVAPIEESMNRFGFFLGWHPNNQEILYLVGDSAYGGLWLLNIQTKVQTIVVQQDPLYIIDGAISPDGQRIAYAQQKGLTAPGELWTVFTDGSEPRLLSTGDVATGLSWSPDNRQIAYFGGEGLCVMNIEDAICKIVARNANIGNLFKPLWSPDGQDLAYVATEPGTFLESKQHQVADWDKEAFIGANIHVIHLTTGEEKILVPIEPSDQITGYIDPTWSPDSKLIAFAGLHGDQGGIWIINKDGTDLHQVAEASTVIRFPVWTK